MAEAGWGPVAQGERIEAMDVLRGFALLGILLMNIEAFVGPLLQSLTGVDPGLSGADRTVDAVIYVLVQGKFMTLFSLLFGMGFALMLERAAARGAGGSRTYARRLLALLAIGLVHALLVWSGDILVSYALFGLVLLLFFRDTPASRLPVWGVALYVLPLVMAWAWALGVEAMQRDPALDAQLQQAMNTDAAEWGAMLEAERQAYGTGSYAQATAQRLADTGLQLSIMLSGGWGVLGLFLFGAWFVRSGVVRDPAAHLPLLRRLRALGLGLGMPLMLWAAWTHPTLRPGEMDFGIAASQSAVHLANLLLSLGYMAVIVLALQSPGGRRKLGWLAPAGRMALTNYLLQSLVCTLVFYGYGLGFFERLPRAWQPLFVVALFALQVGFSHWWLARFRFGPVEWLWRWLTYGRRPAMRQAAG